ncbi:MAG: glycine--tRNA ligase, partial [Clostridia bacterium]|nr:glycine--tRNA ligase [Clostridia bacterium]
FEQMELEFFIKPGTNMEWFQYWREYCYNWLLSLGMKEENLKLRDHSPEELSHYSTATTDIEFMFPFGWGELWGIADRGAFDLTQHSEHCGKPIEYFDPETNEHYIPHVVEPSLGADRSVLAFLVDAYDEEEVAAGDVRTVLRLHPALAPFKCAVLPLSKKLSGKAQEIWETLSKDFMVDYDDAGSIGKRYRRQDEIGTPFCITVDFDTEVDGCVTVRDRDTMQQERVAIADLAEYLKKRIYIY